MLDKLINADIQEHYFDSILIAMNSVPVVYGQAKKGGDIEYTLECVRTSSNELLEAKSFHGLETLQN